MLDIGGWEFLVVAFVLIMVVGPKELPKMLRGFTRVMRQVRSMAAEFSRSMQTMADDAELGDLKSTLEDVKRGNLAGVADAIDPAGNLKDSVEDLKKSASETGLQDDVGEIRNLAGTTGDGFAEVINQAPADDATTDASSDANKKTGS
ncbi:Sec-independent protein translocase protein TatB [Alphaproteobacteria bacterium]|jgi:sec-independent protein translocase protein TatB|nr:Sec-independent protein translocase protein TatB [Alphaproteobacteria bacterium]MDA9824489.1 Sec-independent protein translocase protein TatB [Alphaproteobacteria bacterium]MDG2489455.1 Sec-independent protein translocase protein TatB [Alphaproteobacteria bacterium]